MGFIKFVFFGWLAHGMPTCGDAEYKTQESCPTSGPLVCKWVPGAAACSVSSDVEWMCDSHGWCDPGCDVSTTDGWCSDDSYLTEATCTALNGVWSGAFTCTEGRDDTTTKEECDDLDGIWTPAGTCSDGVSLSVTDCALPKGDWEYYGNCSRTTRTTGTSNDECTGAGKTWKATECSQTASGLDEARCTDPWGYGGTFTPIDPDSGTCYIGSWFVESDSSGSCPTSGRVLRLANPTAYGRCSIWNIPIATCVNLGGTGGGPSEYCEVASTTDSECKQKGYSASFSGGDWYGIGKCFIASSNSILSRDDCHALSETTIWRSSGTCSTSKYSTSSVCYSNMGIHAKWDQGVCYTETISERTVTTCSEPDLYLPGGSCSVASHTTPADCASASGEWTYVYGCSNPDAALTDQSKCEAPRGAWTENFAASCSNPTITNKHDCISPRSNWWPNCLPPACATLTQADCLANPVCVFATGTCTETNGDNSLSLKMCTPMITIIIILFAFLI